MNKDDENYVFYLVGQNLKRIRLSKNISITKLSQISNYSIGFIKNIEAPNYHQTIGLGTVWHLSKVLNISINEFFEPLK